MEESLAKSVLPEMTTTIETLCWLNINPATNYPTMNIDESLLGVKISNAGNYVAPKKRTQS